MSVTLCKRTLKSGNIQYYLAIYKSGEGKRFETLFTVKPENQKEKKKLAELIRSEREMEIISKDTTYQPQHKKKLTLSAYLKDYEDNYKMRDVRMIKSSINKLKEFINNDKFLLSNLSKDYVVNFMHFLNNDEKLKGETPHSYFKRFKKVIKNASEKGYVKREILDVKFKKREDYSDTKLTKQVLTEEEIQILFKTECGNEELKRAFLFACYSGIGYAEVKVLNWSNIVNDRLIINREKTNTEINISLSAKALELLGEKQEKDSLIFNLKNKGKFISESSNNKTLNNWLKKAEIDKHITFYCGRHTFATRLLKNDANLKTVADALGHKSTTHTIKYLNYVNDLKDKATSGL